MAAMSTALIEFANNGSSRTWTTSGHTALKPKLVLQSRKVADGTKIVAEDTITVLQATVDSDGAVLPQKVSLSVTVRRPVNGQATDVTAALAILRDVVAGDEFTGVVNGQNYLKA